jgi:hypothetical protein
LIVNWTDAIRHFDSTLARQPANSDVRHNRELVVRYLKRLRELLKDQSEQAQQQLPQLGEGEPKPQSGSNGDSKTPGQPGEGNQGGQQDPPPGDGGDQQDEQAPDAGERDDKDKPSDDGPEDEKPGETPEERARRILGEKADLQKGPLSPGRFQPDRPEKDW